MRLIIRILINAVALGAAAFIVPNFDVQGNWFAWLVVAAIFGLVNAFIRPVIGFFSIPLSCLTLGLFTFIINAAMVLLTAWFADIVGITMTVGDGGFWGNLWTALLASIVISIVSTVLSWLLPDDRR